MDNNKEIGKAFKEKLSNLKQSPSDLVWDNIVEKLNEKKKKPFFYTLMRAVVIVLFIFSIVFIYNKNSKKTVNNISKSKGKSPKQNRLKEKESYKVSDLKYHKNITGNSKKDISKTGTENTDKKIEITKSNNKTFKLGISNLSKNIYKTILKNHSKNLNIGIALKKGRTNLKTEYLNSKQDHKIAITKKALLDKENKRRKISKILMNNIKQIKNNYPNFIYAPLPKTKNEMLVIKENTKIKKTNFWEISVKGTPIYYGSFKRASAIDNAFSKTNSEKSTIAYNVQLSIPVFNKLKFRMGFSKIDLSYITNNLTTETIYNSQLPLVSEVNIGVIGIQTSGNYLYGYNEELFINPNTTFKIYQNIGYVEIPFEFSYKILNKNIEFNFISGVSFLLLQYNDILINDKFKLTEANNINKLTYTANIGFAIEYPIMKHINFTLEPILKTQFNTYNDKTRYKPYFFGLSSGFVYKF